MSLARQWWPFLPGLCLKVVFSPYVWDALPIAGTATENGHRTPSHFVLTVPCLDLCTLPGHSDCWWRIRRFPVGSQLPIFAGVAHKLHISLQKALFFWRCAIVLWAGSAHRVVWVNLKRQRKSWEDIQQCHTLKCCCTVWITGHQYLCWNESR